MITYKHCNWASSWDYGTYHIGDQRRLRRACASAQSRQSLPCSHTWSMEVVEERSDRKSDILCHWIAAHARLKNEFTEDEKYYNLMTWLNYSLCVHKDIPQCPAKCKLLLLRYICSRRMPKYLQTGVFVKKKWTRHLHKLIKLAASKTAKMVIAVICWLIVIWV